MKLTKLDELVSNNMRLFVPMVLGFLLFAGIVGVAVFFVVLRGEEQVMVPNVQGRELTQALLELQARELNPRIQLRHSQSPHDRGLVLEQDPSPGQIVKAGRRVRLVVSQGTVVNRVENFVGRNIDNVRLDLMAFTVGSGGPILMIREPLIFDYSNDPPGTIIQQSPEAGTDISGPTQLEFVISRGPQHALMTVPQLTGLPLSEALGWISGTGAVFEFSVRELQPGEQGETVVHQSPPAGASVTSNTRISLTVTSPEELSENEVFSLFSHTMSQNPFPLPVRLEALLPTGERARIIDVDFPGGRFTVPYRLPVNSILILSMMDREIHREIVRG
ncbi:MAG: PASTA domain-containing protein [Treponema sp.]|nr:PASTA domain-containing protein [Treponema sp.]